MAQHPINVAMAHQTINEAMAQQPINKAMAQQPINKVMAQQPIAAMRPYQQSTHRCTRMRMCACGHVLDLRPPNSANQTASPDR